jgi:hypothetical protein
MVPNVTVREQKSRRRCSRPATFGRARRNTPPGGSRRRGLMLTTEPLLTCVYTAAVVPGVPEHSLLPCRQIREPTSFVVDRVGQHETGVAPLRAALRNSLPQHAERARPRRMVPTGPRVNHGAALTRDSGQWLFKCSGVGGRVPHRCLLAATPRSSAPSPPRRRVR